MDGSDNELKLATNSVWAGTGTWTATAVGAGAVSGQYLSSTSGYFANGDSEGIMISLPGWGQWTKGPVSR